MKKPELFHKSVNILVDAYFNDTLEHGNCYACAVGNLVAANMGLHYTECKSAHKVRFAMLENNGVYFSYDSLLIGGNWFKPDNEQMVLAEKEIKSTGYSKKQIVKIEESFEGAEFGQNEADYMFNGLMAVVDCLIKIHKGSEEEKLVAKKQFERVLN